jgi:flagella basal body P-ring formation protein FlgA
MYASIISKLMLLAIALMWHSVANAATKVTLRDRVETTKYVVRLGDVAEIECDHAEESRALAELPLLPAPAAGAKRFLQKRELEDLLVARGVDLKAVAIEGAPQIAMLGPTQPSHRTSAASDNRTTVFDRRAALTQGRVESVLPTSSPASRDTTAVVNEAIGTLISKYLKTKSSDAESWSVQCEIPKRHAAALAAATSAPICDGGRAPWTGRQRFEISFGSPHGTTRIPVYADVKPAVLPIVVATRAMMRGDVITAADLELQDIDYVSRQGDRRTISHSIETLLGMEVRQPIAAGSMVFTESLQPPLMVKRGDLIQISTQSGGIRVRTTARALQDRAQGQLVEVESLATKEKFDARVVGPGEAVIVGGAARTIAGRASTTESTRLR